MYSDNTSCAYLSRRAATVSQSDVPHHHGCHALVQYIQPIEYMSARDSTNADRGTDRRGEDVRGGTADQMIAGMKLQTCPADEIALVNFTSCCGGFRLGEAQMHDHPDLLVLAGKPQQFDLTTNCSNSCSTPSRSVGLMFDFTTVL